MNGYDTNTESSFTGMYTNNKNNHCDKYFLQIALGRKKEGLSLLRNLYKVMMVTATKDTYLKLTLVTPSVYRRY